MPTLPALILVAWFLSYILVLAVVLVSLILSVTSFANCPALTDISASIPYMKNKKVIDSFLLFPSLSSLPSSTLFLSLLLVVQAPVSFLVHLSR